MKSATDAEIREAIDKLDSLFGFKDTKWRRAYPWDDIVNSRAAYYDDKANVIVLGSDVSIGHLVHEFAHVVQVSRHGTRVQIYEAGHHAQSFITALEDVAERFYGHASAYPMWDDEYPHITGYAFAKGYTGSPLTRRIRGSDWA